MDDKQNNYAGNAKNTCDKCGKPVDGYFEYGKVEKPGEYIVKDKENHCADQGIQQQLKKEFKAKLKNFENRLGGPKILEQQKLIFLSILLMMIILNIKKITNSTIINVIIPVPGILNSSFGSNN